MSGRRRRRGGNGHTFRGRRAAPAQAGILEVTSLAEIRYQKEIVEKRRRVIWDQHNELAYQRRAIEAELFAALNASAIAYDFPQWQRVVRFKYCLHPLSAVGSLRDPGGRFNIGDVSPSVFSPFPALYIAENKETALDEALAQERDPGSSLTALEFALARPNSISAVEVHGHLDAVIDLRTTASLDAFIAQTRHFKLSKKLVSFGKKVGFPNLHVIMTTKELRDSLLDEYWRVFPAVYDIPANPQIFGQLAFFAGIDGIVYPSRFSGKECLAIYPKNLTPGSGFIEITGDVPKGCVHTRIDSTNFAVCELPG